MGTLFGHAISARKPRPSKGIARLVCLSLLLLGVALPTAGAPGTAAAAPPAPAIVQVSREVRDRLAREGTARVIVELRLPLGPHVPEGDLSSAAAVTLQRRDIAAGGGRVLARLASRVHKLLRRYRSMPYLALEVGPAALQEIEASPADVVRVLEDRVNQASLTESVPLIGADQGQSLGFDGAGTVVAIIDSGVERDHPFLAGRVVEEACYSSTVSGRSTTVCPNGLEEQTGPGAAAPCVLEGCWHGTHVAGIAAGNGAPASVPFSGVAPGAGIMAVQVFSRFTRFTDCGGFPPCAAAWTSDVLAGIERVYDLRGAHPFAAVNMSIGGGSFSAPCDGEPYKPIIDNLRSAGIAAIVASGNSGSTSAMSSPACVSSAVSVAATTKTDVVSSFSNVASFLKLFAPGEIILSSATPGGYAIASGTSMAAPHVTGAWATLRQADPTRTVSDLLATLEQSGLAVTDTRPGGGVSRPRIRVAEALALLLPDTPLVSAVAPGQGTSGTSVALTVTGQNFQPGATVNLGAGITVGSVTVSSTTQLLATIGIAVGAAPGPRDVTVTNPNGKSGAKPGAFQVVPPPASLALAWSGKLRDRVGQGNTAVAPDGTLDATFLLTLQPGSGARTVTALEIRRADAGGIWDTLATTPYWILGAATGPDTALLNSAQAAVAIPLAEGQSLHLFAADTTAGLFAPGQTFSVKATMADGSVASASVTIPIPPAASLALAWSGKLRDRVGQGNTAVAPDGTPDATFLLTLQPGSGARTVTALEIRRADAGGIWDTLATTPYWILGAATGPDTALLNSAQAAVAIPLAEGQSLHLFAADTTAGLFAPGQIFSVKATMADGSVASASVTLPAAPPVPPPASLALAWSGKLRDRVGQGNAAITPDGTADATFLLTLQPGSGARTVTALELRRADASGIWDTLASTPYWILGAATGPDTALLNSAQAAVAIPLAEGQSLHLFAADTTAGLFAPGQVFSVKATMADGSVASASVTLPTPPPASLALAWSGKLRDRVGQGNTAVAPDGTLDATFLLTLQPGSGARTVTALEIRRADAGGIWDTLATTPYWILGAATGPDTALLNSAQAAVAIPLAEGQSLHLFAADTTAGLFAPGQTFSVKATMADGSTATVSVIIGP